MKLERALEHLERAGYTTLEQVEALSAEALEKALGDNLAYRVSEALPEIKVRSLHPPTHTCTPHILLTALPHTLISRHADAAGEGPQWRRAPASLHCC